MTPNEILIQSVLKIKNKKGEWVLAAIPDEGTSASKLCKIIIHVHGQSTWGAWFNGKHVAFDGDVIVPLSLFAKSQIELKFRTEINSAGMTIGEVWKETGVA